ncbi:MAG: dihydroorotate dehydrogenase electron transfer subunit [Clostridia bacterium]|nr:dihydroorotate dehydrogenase electron transfer subunit [Clostridia bacterium]
MIGKIKSNKAIIEGKSLYEMVIDCGADAAPGQFVMLLCGNDTTLRRPISIAESEGGCLTICYDVRGKGTEWLSERKAGDQIDLLSPIGKGFEVSQSGRALLVGGGIGIYPLLPLARAYGDRSTALLGFRSEGMVNYTENFEKYGCDTEYITDDRGFVTSLVKNELEKGGYDVIHTCGPRPMMAAVAALAKEYGVKCEVSMEERMACGVGACHGCICKTLFKSNEGIEGEHYRRVCVDGPVFDAEEIVW